MITVLTVWSVVALAAYTGSEVSGLINRARTARVLKNL